MSCNITLKTNIPKTATKNLMLQSFGDNKRKLVVSTNWLPLFGFEKDCFTKEEYEALEKLSEEPYSIYGN